MPVLVVDIDSLYPIFQTYGADASRTNVGLAAPTVTVVPEPSSLAFPVTLTGLCSLLGLGSCLRGRGRVGGYPCYLNPSHGLKHVVICLLKLGFVPMGKRTVLPFWVENDVARLHPTQRRRSYVQYNR